MELLYLWIEDYKNIKNQGFNFSPEFEFTFKEETRELSVEKRAGLPENFFGDNIVNVTAIVGENGTGKSSLLEFIDVYLGSNLPAVICWRNEVGTINTFFEGEQTEKVISLQNNKIAIPKPNNNQISLDSFVGEDEEVKDVMDFPKRIFFLIFYFVDQII